MWDVDDTASLAALFVARLGAVEADPFPETFEWTDGFDGREIMHVAALRVRWADGSLTFVDAMRRCDLAADRELGGTRRRIEAECLALGGTHEIWTGTDVARVRSSCQAPRPADGGLRAAHLEALATRPAIGPSIIGRAISDAGYGDVREVDGNWLGRNVLTGIPYLLLPADLIDPATGLALRPDWPTAVDTFRRSCGDRLRVATRHSRTRAAAAQRPGCCP